MTDTHAHDTRQLTVAAIGLALAVAVPFWTAAASPSSSSPRCRDGFSRGSQIRSNDQEGHSSTFVSIDDDKCFRAEMRGDVSITDDDADLRLGPDAYALLMQSAGGDETQLELRTDSQGRETRQFSVNGQSRPASEGAAWLRATLPGLVRESGFAAEQRVERFWRQGGAPAVLREVDQISHESIKRIYLNYLLDRGQLSRDDLRQVTQRVARFESDAEKRIVLTRVIDQRQAGIGDVVDATRSISSDAEKRIVLSRVLDRASLNASDAAALLNETHDMKSDAERRIVLSAASSRVPLDDSDVRAAFFGSVDGMQSSAEQRIVLSSVLERARLDPATLVALLHSAKRIDSDAEKAIVLTDAASHADFHSEGVRAAFDDAAKSISSRAEYDRVMRAAAR